MITLPGGVFQQKHLELAPITMIMGANGVGKSEILNAIGSQVRSTRLRPNGAYPPEVLYTKNMNPVETVGLYGHCFPLVLCDLFMHSKDRFDRVVSGFSAIGYSGEVAIKIYNRPYYRAEFTGRPELTGHWGAMAVVVALHVGKSPLLIEHPGATLDYDAQRQLMDLIIAASKSRTVVFETHSEPMLRRLQRRIADGTIPSKMVKVLYLEREGNTTDILTFEITEFGDICNYPDTNELEDIVETVYAQIERKTNEHRN